MVEDPGFLLVQAGLVRDDQLRTAREARAQGGGTLGEHLVMAGAVDDDVLTEFYAAKLVVPRVAASDLARIPAAVLRRIPPDMAAEFRVVPVWSDGDLNLTLAMSDPADQHVADEVAFFTGASVVRAVATQLQIAWALAHYYGVVTPLAHARLSGTGNAANGSSTAVDAALAAAEPFTPPVAWEVPTEVEEEEETGPARLPIARRRPTKRRISELAPRSGTLDGMPEPPPEPERLPAVVVDDEELTGRRDFDGSDDEAEDEDWRERTDEGEEQTVERRPATEPLLLDHPSANGSSGNGVSLGLETGSGDILLLDRLKDRHCASSPQIEPGLGRLGSVDSRPRASHDTGASHGSPWAENEGENETVRRQSKADRRGRKSRSEAATDPGEAGPDANDSMHHLSATPPAAPPETRSEARSDSNADEASEPTTDPGEVTTNPMRTMSMGAGTGSGGPTNVRSDWNVDDGWDVDDGWGPPPNPPSGSVGALPAGPPKGPPGSTIPPEYLGTFEDEDSGKTPVALAQGTDGTGMDPAAVAAASAAAASAAAAAALASTPLVAAVPVSEPVLDESTLGPAELAAELERSSNRLLETLRALERAPGRDEIVDILLDHLGASMRRRAFFAVKGGMLFAFRQYGAARPGVGTVELSLEQPSTFGQVALNRLVYRGTLSPAAVEFVEHALGSAGRGESVVVPVAVKGRPVALLYGDGLTAVVIEEHQTVLGRAAGQAFERILSKRPGRDSGSP